MDFTFSCIEESLGRAAAGGYASLRSIGESRDGRPILQLELAAPDISPSAPYVLYVGCHHALESLTAFVLCRFCETVTRLLGSGHSIYNIKVENLLAVRRIAVLPCLNPDGLEIFRRGFGASPTAMSRFADSAGLSPSRWQANAYGVDLNHNYREGFPEYKAIEEARGIKAGETRYSGEYPESEPECAALAELIRRRPPSAILALHSQGEVIYPGSAVGEALAAEVSRLIGYPCELPEDSAKYGGLSDYTSTLGIPSFTVELGLGQNPLPDACLPRLYARAERLLFRLPTLV